MVIDWYSKLPQPLGKTTMSQRFLFACPTGSVKIEIKPFHPEGTVSSSKKDPKDDAEDDDEVIIVD